MARPRPVPPRAPAVPPGTLQKRSNTRVRFSRDPHAGVADLDDDLGSRGAGAQRDEVRRGLQRVLDAAGYLTKRATRAGLVDAVITVHAGGSVVAPQLAAELLREYARMVKGGGAPGAVRPLLTARERPSGAPGAVGGDVDAVLQALA